MKTPTQIVEVEVEVTARGYRHATSFEYGAILIVRPDGSHCYANVKEDSELYAVLNSALFTP